MSVKTLNTCQTIVRQKKRIYTCYSAGNMQTIFKNLFVIACSKQLVKKFTLDISQSMNLQKYLLPF
jgi:hypothetical protein